MHYNTLFFTSELIDDVVERLKQVKVNTDEPLRANALPLAKAENIYPCLIVVLGSAVVYLKVNNIYWNN